jgi:hypothetical protein
MPQMAEACQWHGRKVVDKGGEPVGKVQTKHTPRDARVALERVVEMAT